MRRRLASFTLAIFLMAMPCALFAQSGTSIISGTVLDEQGGLPVSGATVTLYQTTALATTSTAADGSFRFANVAAGQYTVGVSATAFGTTRSTDIVVTTNGTVAVNITLVRESASTDRNIIGRTSSADPGRSLQASTTITRSLDPQVLVSQGFNRLGEGLGLLPGVNLRGQNGNVGDDLYIDIRGLKPSETQTLIDGHPIGPIGVNASTTSGGYDYMASPIVGLRNVQVTYGAGALGLYGTDSAGGTVDWQTLDPSATPTARVVQSLGSLGHLTTLFTTSGQFGRFGIVLAHGVNGSQGLFSGDPQLQSGLLGTNLTTANIQKYTYPVSGDAIVRGDMAKLRYDFGPATQLTLTAFAANAWEDKTGTGNNYTPYATQLYSTLSKGLAKSGPCTGMVAVTTDQGASCLDPYTYSSLTSGPAGTGAGRFTTTGDQDYHARLTSRLFDGFLTFDAFQNTYRYNNPTPISQTTTVPTFATDLYQTFGFLASDDYTWSKNELGAGWYVQHQRYDGIRNNYFNPLLPAPTPETSINTANIFIRDVYRPTRALQLFVNAWYKQSTSSETNANSIDPRASLVIRPTANDVIRFTGGKSVGLPDPVQSIGTGITNANSLNPQCGSLVAGVGGISVGTPGVSGLQPETSTDVEAAYGHKFADGTLIQGDYYNSSVKNLLFTTSLNASLYPPGTIPPAILGDVNGGIFGRVYNYSAACKALLNPANPQSLLPYLAFSVPTNAANGLFRGIELTVRHPISSELSFEATWDVQSAVDLNVPTLLLKQNVFLINGAQVFGIPLQKQSVAFDLNAADGLLGHLDATRFGSYNQFDAQPFIVTNVFLGYRFGPHITLSAGGTNVLGARNATYAQTGVGLYVPENQYGTDTTPFTQSATYNKLRSYQPPQGILTLTLQI